MQAGAGGLLVEDLADGVVLHSRHVERADHLHRVCAPGGAA